MSLLQTSYTMHQESPLFLPPPPAGMSTHEVQQLGMKVALELLHDHQAMIDLNPLVTGVEKLAASDPHAVDYGSLTQHFETVDTTVSDVMCQPWMQYAIKDDLPLAFGYKRELTYYSAIRGLPSGFESFTNPGSGVLLYGRWHIGLERLMVEEADDHHHHHQRQGSQHAGGDDMGNKWETVIRVQELGEVRANWFLAQYIKMTYPSSHKVMHTRFREQWEKRMQRALQG